ncbi:MAG: ATP-binding protein [Desulfohalobiaceae bacterium]|nr:ATP-binding protein [Desulfohalobiaceae bacterium]
MTHSFLRYRFLSQILPGSSTKRLVVLTGARQTGKTTLARKLYPDLTYINLDAPENREILSSVSSILWSQSIGNAVIDEAQKLPDIFEKVKYAFDENTILFSLLTGSSQILLLKNIRESLAGRAFFYELWPLMQAEVTTPFHSEQVPLPILAQLLSDGPFAEVLNNCPPVLLETQDARLRQTEDYILAWGGMPALLELSAAERRQWLKNYGYTYLERDLGDLAKIDDLLPFHTFQKLSALRSARLLNYSELARDAGLSVDTARRYIEYLKISYQVFSLQPYYHNITSTVVKTPKIYWVDVGILRQLTGFWEGISGEIFETMIVSEIFKLIRTYQLEVELYFYRTRSGKELDLLIETVSGIIGVEIKSRDKVYHKDLRAMQDVALKLGKQWLGGLLVYRGRELHKIADPNIWQVPSRRLLQ